MHVKSLLIITYICYIVVVSLTYVYCNQVLTNYVPYLLYVE
jgi:hypothetical protein